MMAPLSYRPCVGIMLLNADSDVFVGRRIDNTAEAWQMPQGGIDANEAPYEAALRELKEETGIDQRHVCLLAETEEWLHYDLPAELIPKLWGGQFCGQKQKWYALRFLGRDNDINIATHHPEFLDWKWVPIETLPDIIVPFKRTLYQELVTRFSGL